MIHVYFCPRCPVITLVRDNADTSMHGHPALDRLSHRAFCPICTQTMSYSGAEPDSAFVHREPEPEPEQPKAKRKYTRRVLSPRERAMVDAGQSVEDVLAQTRKAPAAEPEPSGVEGAAG